MDDSALGRAIQDLCRAYKRGPLSEQDPEHVLAFYVVREYLEQHKDYNEDYLVKPNVQSELEQVRLAFEELEREVDGFKEAMKPDELRSLLASLREDIEDMMTRHGSR
jgi:hypothetical protein